MCLVKTKYQIPQLKKNEPLKPIVWDFTPGSLFSYRLNMPFHFIGKISACKCVLCTVEVPLVCHRKMCIALWVFSVSFFLVSCQDTSSGPGPLMSEMFKCRNTCPVNLFKIWQIIHKFLPLLLLSVVGKHLWPRLFYIFFWIPEHFLCHF